ncbi:MAG: SdrD B-like domain-containing protein [Saprospiraceae bacterium]
MNNSSIATQWGWRMVFTTFLALLITIIASAQTCPPVIDFSTDAQGNPLQSGDLLFEKFVDFGMHITTDAPTQRPPMIFDSANPSGGDADLGTPNVDFGGPGSGDGGRAGRIGENNIALGNSMIISEDANSGNPDDNGFGGTITFTFDNPVEVSYVQIVDVDYGETDGRIRLYDGANNLLREQRIIAYGDNSFQNIILDTDQVRRMEIFLASSGSIQALYFCESIPPNATVGDLVWYDYNSNGVQDQNEPGIPDVRLQLFGDGGQLLAEDVTDANGNYLFPNLMPGDYEINVVASTLPNDVQQTYDLDGSLNNASGNFELQPSETRLDVDFGYKAPCSLTITSVNTTYCALNQYAAEITLEYNNAPGELNINDCTFLPASNTGQEQFTLRGLTCAAAAVQIQAQFVNDAGCNDDQIVTPPCPKVRLCKTGRK